MKENPPFLGRGWSFPPNFSRGQGRAIMVDGLIDIQQSLRILLSTTVGERLMHPRFGCDLHPYLFGPVNAAMIATLRSLIKTAILLHEPRIKLDSLTLKDETLEGRLLIEIEYVVIATNSRANLVYPYYLTEATGAEE